MRRISAKIISKPILNPTPTSPTSISDFVLRVYPPQKFIDGAYNKISILLFKNGNRIYYYERQLAQGKLERALSYASAATSIFDINLNMADARAFSSSVKKGVQGKYESFMIVHSDKMPGEVYKLSIIETDQLIIGYESTALPASTFVSKEEDLPSRANFSRNYTDDPEKFDLPTSRNKNQLSLYDKNLSLSYYLADKNTVRVALTNIPAGYKRIEILARKNGQSKFNEKSVKKILEQERNPMSNWFFAGVTERGGNFTESGGYVLFDLQMFADERNTIVERVNKVSQNYFRNSRNQDGQLTTAPVTGLPLFPVPNANGGELAQIKVKLYADCGRQNEYVIPVQISTMGYAEPRIIFNSNPNRLLTIPATRELMTSNAINESNEGIYRESVDASGISENDIMIDLNVNIAGQTGIPSAILDLFGGTEDSGTGGELSARTGGSFLVAFVSRYDSYTGNTYDLGFTAKNKIFDKIYDASVSTSLASIIGSTSNRISPNTLENFNKTISASGLSLVYNFDFYEVTPEILAAYKSANGIDDEESAPLLQNIGIGRRSESEDFNSFISNLLRARTPLQTSNISFDYLPKQKRIPNLSTRLIVKQQDTNMPYYEVSGQILDSYENLAFLEAFRIERSRIVTSKIKNSNTKPENFASKEIRLGIIDVSSGRFSFNDFTPKDNIEGSVRGKEKSIKTYYKLVPYGYVIKNGLLSDTIQKFDTEIIVGE